GTGASATNFSLRGNRRPERKYESVEFNGNGAATIYGPNGQANIVMPYALFGPNGLFSQFSAVAASAALPVSRYCRKLFDKNLDKSGVHILDLFKLIDRNLCSLNSGFDSSYFWIG